MAQLKSVVPVSDEDTNALPVKDLGPAIAFYEGILGFSAVSRDAATVVLARDGVRIGLARDGDHEPSRAGSVAFEVDDLGAMYREIQARGGNPGEFGTDDWGGEQYRTFFLREDTDGYCYCFYQPADSPSAEANSGGTASPFGRTDLAAPPLPQPRDVKPPTG